MAFFRFSFKQLSRPRSSNFFNIRIVYGLNYHEHPGWEPPYLATIFTTQLSDDLDGYDKTSDLMAELVEKYDGFIGMHSARDEEGYGITVCYWKSEDAIAAWREDLKYQVTQSKGRGRWYSRYTIQIVEVQRSTSFEEAYC